MAKITMIACVSRDGGLGKDGQLLWHIPEDMQFFKKMTSGHPVIMGRNTYVSIGRPLPGRKNIVLSRHPVEGDVQRVSSVEELDEYLNSTDEEVFIIGGAALYELFILRCDKLYLTEVDATRPADVYFPQFAREDFASTVLQSGVHEGVVYNIIEYQRKAPA